MSPSDALAFDMAASAWIGVVTLVYVAIFGVALAIVHGAGLLSIGDGVDGWWDRACCWVVGIDGEEA